MKLVIATGNKGKISEIRELLNDIPIDILSLTHFPGMPEIIEDGATFLDNALIKARFTAKFTGHPSLADDSGLEVDALSGKPGVLSARYAPTTEERNYKLLKELESVPDHLRTARFVCALALARPDGFEWSTTGTCEGSITYSVSGDGGFGYDPVFYYQPLGKTFAELSREEKNSVSHRGKALRAFKKAVLAENLLK